MGAGHRNRENHVLLAGMLTLAVSACTSSTDRSTLDASSRDARVANAVDSGSSVGRSAVDASMRDARSVDDFDSGSLVAGRGRVDAAIRDATITNDFDTGTPTGGSVQDASVTNMGGASFADDFAERVRAVSARVGGVSTCVSPLASIPVATPDEARAAVRAFIAKVRGVSPNDLAVTVTDCGGATGQTCARRFQHDIYKSNGIYGEMLYPLAQELESRGASVEDTIWVPTVDGSTLAAEVCISGIVDGFLVGIVMFNDWQRCR